MAGTNENISQAQHECCQCCALVTLCVGYESWCAKAQHCHKTPKCVYCSECTKSWGKAPGLPLITAADWANVHCQHRFLSPLVQARHQARESSPDVASSSNAQPLPIQPGLPRPPGLGQTPPATPTTIDLKSHVLANVQATVASMNERLRRLEALMEAIAEKLNVRPRAN